MLPKHITAAAAAAAVRQATDDHIQHVEQQQEHPKLHSKVLQQLRAEVEKNRHPTHIVNDLNAKIVTLQASTWTANPQS